MNTVFIVLLLLTLGLWAWSLVSPQTLSRFSKKPLSRQTIGTSLGCCIVVFAVLAGVTSNTAHTPSNINPDNPTKATAQKVAISEQAKKAVPVITTKTITETKILPFEKQTVADPNRPQDEQTLTTVGVNGTLAQYYELTYTDGQQTSKRLISEEQTALPITETTSIGTKVAAVAPPTVTKPKITIPKPSTNCDPNYSGACVPIARDVDCAGGSGNGPAYVKGPVTVIGIDIYKLDRDGNGVACE